MTKIIRHPGQPEQTIDDLLEESLIGIIANKKKYILVAKKDSFAFICGDGNWLTYTDRTYLLKQIFYDDRVQIHIFSDLVTMGKWMSED